MNVRVVYIENVFFLNWIIDYFLLLGTASFAGVPLQRARFAISSAAGGLYAVAVFLPRLAILAFLPIELLVGCMMALAAFWPLQKRWHLTAQFFLLSAALAGIVMAASLIDSRFKSFVAGVYYIKITWPLLLGSTVVLYLVLRLAFRQSVRHGKGELMVITACIQQQQRQFTALYDTGNTLRDPVSGRAALVLEQRALQGIWPSRIEEILLSSQSPEDKMVRLYNEGVGTAFTLLPYRSVGISTGLLLAVRSDYIKVGKSTYPATWIALCEGAVSDGGCYQALWGGAERRGTGREILASNPALDPQTQQAG